jgi:acyl CoA:acetate/3-ketoacid CoA transferase alpha subunit
MRVSIYNDGDNPLRVTADRKAANAIMIDAGEEAVVEAENVVQLVEIDGGNSEASVEDDDHEEDLEP